MRLRSPEALTRVVPEERFAQAAPRVAIVILNWNGEKVLRECLRSVFALSYPAAEAIVVDNGSSDGSVEMVRREFGNCFLIENPVNVGFSAGNNQGICLALERGNDYVMVLNNDTVLDRGCLTWLVERAKSDSRIAAVSPKIYFSEPPNRLWFAGGTFSYWKGRNGQAGYGRRDGERWSRAGEMEFISGCALLAPRRVWEEVGGFDELFFWSGEDVDWSLRLRKAGYKLFYEPRALVWHRVSYSMLHGDGEAGRLYYYTRNNLLYMWRHARWWHWLTFVPYLFALSAKRALEVACARDWKSIPAILRGARDFPRYVREFRRTHSVKADRYTLKGLATGR
jgi:hypothetical protein